jgi:hypothetical protein
MNSITSPEFSVVSGNILLIDGEFTRFTNVRKDPEHFARTLGLAKFVITAALDAMYEKHYMQYQKNIAQGLMVSEVQRSSVFVMHISTDDKKYLSEKGLYSRDYKPRNRGVYEDIAEFNPPVHRVWTAIAEQGFIPEATNLSIKEMKGLCLAVRDTPRREV